MPTLSSNIVKREIASVHDVEEALARQSLYGGDLVTNLLELARVSEEHLTHAVAESVGLKAAPAGELPLATERVRRMVPGELAHRYALYPLAEKEGKLVVAVSEPLPAEVESDLEFSLGLSLEQRAATRVRVQQAVCRDYGLALDQRVARVLARLNGSADPHPSVRAPAPEAAAPIVTVAASGSPPTPEDPREAAESSAPPRAKPALARVDLGALARAAARARRQRRRLGPYTAAMAEADLREAETRDDVMAAFFDFACQYFEYSALLAVHGDLAEGRDAHGAGAARSRVLGIGIPLDLPSTLSAVTTGESYHLVRLSASGLDGALAKDLERRPGPRVLLLPVRVRERAVLVLYGDHGETDVQLSAVGDLISFAPLVAAALERVILRRKGAAEPARLPGARLGNERHLQRQKALPNNQDRVNALATALKDAPMTVARISSPAPASERGFARNANSERRSEASLARPVISVGPRARLTPPHGAPIPRLAPPPPPELSESAPFSHPPVTPLWGSPYSIPPTSRTPIPSSLAPGAPPQRAAGTEEAGFADRDASTKPGVGLEETPLLRAIAPARSLTPVRMPPPPPRAAELSPIPFQLALTPSPESARRLELVPSEPPHPEVTVEETILQSSAMEELLADSEPMAYAPQSRSLAHSARPLPPPGYSEELRLPTVIVDLAHDTEELVERGAEGDPVAADRLVEIGAAAVPALVGAFPGLILSELRRGVGDGPPRASECGPLLKILARIGPKAAGVLGVRTNDSDPVVRSWATRLLGEMPCIDSARAVARRFIDDDADVRKAALAAGRMLQTHSGAGGALSSTLSDMLLDGGRTNALSHMVIEALADLREARAIPALAALLASGPDEVRRSAHWALVVLARTDLGGDAAAWEHWWRVNSSRHRVEWLIDALMHETAEIRRAAGDELKGVTKEYFGYYDDLPPRERERAQTRYRDWWENKGKARFMAPYP